MQLFYSPFQTFVHTVLDTVSKCGRWGRVERVETFRMPERLHRRWHRIRSTGQRERLSF